MLGARTTDIRTPDRRLRVFVSSTLAELAEERAAVSRAISALRLTPVMFEIGARPHPPQELYRAYVAQSDIFIGLYWQRYGWIGPGMSISGVEDELERARELPRLLYVKTPAPDREPRLDKLLDRIRQGAADSYRSFSTARELGRLVRDDLALLLSERFATNAEDRRPRAEAAKRLVRSLPVDTTTLVDREQEVDDVARLLELPETRFVTLTGPGGIGKSRLAVAVADRIGDHYESGAAFAALASTTTPELALVSIASAAGADATSTRSPVDVLIEQLGDASMLLVIDNVERVARVGRDLVELLARCPRVAILATSRTALQLRAEHEYPVPALSLPPDADEASMDQLASSPAVALFVDRARAVHPDFELTLQNAAAVAAICRRLDGLPLAIELAAARTRVLEPAALWVRLESSLDALGTGPMDLPERQRTLRATVDWSVGLLDSAERSMLSTLAVFLDGWTIDAAASVAGLADEEALDVIEGLVSQSLVQVDRSAKQPRFRMLETVREFVAESVGTSSDTAGAQRRHADYFRNLADQADVPLRSAVQAAWVDRLQMEAANVGAAIRWLLTHDVESLPRLLRSLWPFLAVRGHFVEVQSWIDELMTARDTLRDQTRAELFWLAVCTALQLGDDRGALASEAELEAPLTAIDDSLLEPLSHLAIAWVLPINDDFDGALRHAWSASNALREHSEPFWTANALMTLGLLEIAVGRLDDARPHLTQVLDVNAAFDDAWLSIASSQLATVAIMQDRFDDARGLLDDSLAKSLDPESVISLTICLTAFARLACARGDYEQAVLLLGATDGLRRRVGLRVWPALRRGEAELVEQLEPSLDTENFAISFSAGTRLSRRGAVALIRGHDRGEGGRSADAS